MWRNELSRCHSIAGYYTGDRAIDLRLTDTSWFPLAMGWCTDKPPVESPWSIGDV